MYPARHHRVKAKQRGAALMVMLVILVMGIAAVLVNSLSTTMLKNARQEKTAAALAQAKEALIGRAASDTNRPGELPCPDVDGDGQLTMNIDYGPGTLCKQFVGYLPWKTLGLPELRDGTNTKLWYAVSQNFYAGNTVALNSDTPGQLSISGNQNLNNIAAIIFAPGTPLCGKSHSTNNVDQYLEAMSSVTATSAVVNTNSNDCDNSPYNDNLLAITASQVFQPVEKRVGSEIKQILKTYYTAWSAFPFAAPFADPSTSSFTGQAATYNGLLPIGNNVMPTWAGIPTVSFSGGGSYDFCELRNGSATNSRWRCRDIVISAGETITITGILNDAGRGFWRPHNINNVCEVRARDSSGTTVLATSLFAPNSVIVTNSLNSDGSANIVFRATGKTGGTTLQRIEFRDILSYSSDIKIYSSNSPTCPQTSTSPVIPKWLFNDSTYGNNWQQVAYYAVSPGYAPGGGNACNPLPGTPSCQTVNGSGGGNNKRAVVVMTGGALADAHSSGNLADYLEGENVTPADYIYENKSHSNIFNDQVIIVAP